MPVPVADSQTKSNRAASGVGFGTTGAVRMTAPCSPGMSQRSVTWLSAALVAGSPQVKTNTVRRAHGTQACVTDLRVSGSSLGSTAPTATATSCSYRQLTAGCQTRSNSARLTSDTTPAATSTSQGPWKLDTANCITANVPPE